MANITDFKMVGDARTVTKVRVSTDNGDTWGILYQAIKQGIYLKLNFIENSETWNTVSIIEIPYNSSLTYRICYNVIQLDELGNESYIDSDDIEYTVNYNDNWENGIKHFDIPVVYEGVNYTLSFDAEVRVQTNEGYRIEQNGNASITFHPHESETDKISTPISYVIKTYNRDTGDIINDNYSSGTVTSDEYTYAYIAEYNDYTGLSDLIGEESETHYIYIDDIEYEFEATIKFYNGDYVDMITCSVCGEKYPESDYECPHCGGVSMVTCDVCGKVYDEVIHGDCPDFEYHPIEVICSKCGDSWMYVKDKYTACAVCGTPVSL